MLAGSQKVRKYVALDQEYIKQNDLTEAKQLADVVWKKINNFITYLNKRGDLISRLELTRGCRI